MTSRRAPSLGASATDLLTSIAEAPTAIVAGQVIADYFAAAGDVLKAQGLLKPAGERRAATSLVDHEDEPVDLVWSGEHGGYGYFSPAVGWVTVPISRLALFGVDLNALIKHVLGLLDGADEIPIVLIPDLLWEVGRVRLPGRAKRVPVWIARRLGDPAVWARFLAAVRLRPAPGLRVVLTLTSAERLPAQILRGHEMINIRDVSQAGSLAVDPDLLAARIASGASQNDDAITMAADGASVTVRGSSYAFSGSKQRAVIRQLYEAWTTDNPKCLTAQVLEGAGFSRTVNTIAKAFSGRADWREFIKEERGRCWMFT